jgi:glycosyltransferase involved in cell wall biosynthesis
MAVESAWQPSQPTVDVVIPVFNEERALPRSIPTLLRFLESNYLGSWAVVIVDNGSADATLTVARALAEDEPRLRVVHLDQRGRGRALRRAWLESAASVVSYMDVDLSTGLAAFPHLIQAIVAGADVAIGSRLLPGSRVERRPLRREVASRAYNLLIRLLFPGSGIADAQCGFKAVRTEVAQRLVPLIQDNAWFFDTELLLLARRFGYRLAQVPVYWTDDPDSRVRILSTAWEDIKGLLRVRFRPPPGRPD